MGLTAGTRLGPYEVLAPLGAGGMGEVYRARDTRLNREVAIKVLPAAVVDDPERLARFEREAQVLASLNHPNIGHIYGLEENGPASALVLELIEGPTLADRIAQGAIEVGEALPIARQIAEALDAAHERGIIHRDLKPANIKLRPDGTVKVLDFGLAKALDPAGASASDAMTSPTLTGRATQAGVILGTAAYMAPEQARGKAVDRRADIWAFGVVLYEMLAGRLAFPGETITDIVAAIVTREPDWTALPPATPPAVRRLLARCFVKDPKRRLRDIGEAGLAIAETIEGKPVQTDGDVTAPAPSAARVRWLAWSAAALALALVGSLVWVWWVARPADHPLARLDIQTPARTTLNLVAQPAVAVSADGATFAFVAATEGISRVYVRGRTDAEARPLNGTEGASDPVFSPDGKWLAFVAGRELKKIPLNGPAVPIAKVLEPRGVTWVDDHTLVYAAEPVGPLLQIAADGGAPKPISTVDASKGERTHRWPYALPGGNAVLFTVGTVSSPDDYDASPIDALILATGERRKVLDGASMVRYAPTGHLIFARAGALYAVGFDLDRLAINGAPVNVLHGVAGDVTTGAVHFSVADDGTFAYVPGRTKGNLRRLVWADAAGSVQALGLAPGLYNDPRISPDGTRAAVVVGASGSGDVWIYDLRRMTFARLTFTGTNASPFWSADGQSVYYASVDQGGARTTVFRGPADGSRDAAAVGSVNSRAYLEHVDRAGTFAVIDYRTNVVGNRVDVMGLPLARDAAPRPIVQSPSTEYGGAVSPDGKRIAYQSDESNRPEIYVKDLTGAGGRWQISTTGGEEPRWSPDGRTLYYRFETRLMAVPIETRPQFSAGAPRVLVDGIFNLRSDTGMSYDVDPKSGRFLMIRPANDDGVDSTTSIRVALNWFGELRRLTGGK